MKRVTILIMSCTLSLPSWSQEKALSRFLSDSSMKYGTLSLCIADTDSTSYLFKYNAELSLTPASILKLVTTAAALELLGPDHTFTTVIGYNGTLNKRTGRLNGDIVIRGGGDPVLGSKNFEDHYGDFIAAWTDEIKKLGIRSVKGRIITDDSYYDYLPIPAKWVWEDAGNYYGAGAYGLSVYDNTYEIHFMTSADSTAQQISHIEPEECNFEFSNWLVAAGTSDEGYVFAAPYSTNGWLSGTIPANLDDFFLKASIADPPRLMAKIIDSKLEAAGISITGEPTTARLLRNRFVGEINTIASITSPPLKDIIEVLNHESVNMYAEHIVKELGKFFRGKGSTIAGIEVITGFLENSGVNNPGMFIEDGSGLSPFNAVNARGITDLLLFMKKEGKYFSDFMNSLPVAGKEGTLSRYFKDPVFESKVTAKSGSMTRVRSYAGYLTTVSGNELVFSIIVNNFTGSSREIIRFIEEILSEVIITN